MKNAGWMFSGVLMVILLYVLFFQPKKKDLISMDAFNKTVKDTAAYYETLLLADSFAIDLAIARTEEAGERSIKLEQQLDISEIEIKQLAVRLQSARKETRDSSWISVSPRYINACDSLEIAADKQNEIIDGYKISNQVLSKLVATESEAYKKALQDQKDFRTAMQKSLDSCTKIAEQQTALPEKRTQVYAGANLYGNKTDIINGGQICLTLLTKRNTMFELNGLLINDKIYAGVGAKFLISFRRK